MSEQCLQKEWVADIPSPQSFETYYDPAGKHYWIQNARGNWIEVNETSVRRHLKQAGFQATAGNGESLSQVDKEINRVQTELDLAFAGPLAGHRAGVHTIVGNRVLVTNSPMLIVPKPGNCSTVMHVLRNLFHDPKHNQVDYVFAWTKVAVESLQAGTRMPGQALAIAGPADSGKSLFQDYLTGILGGRAAKPYRYMSGKTQFNGELFGAEHQMIEDDVSSTDIRSRLQFGAQIKQSTVNRIQSCHIKHQQAISLTPFWRLTISLNEEPENLLILPPLDESLADKIILLKAAKAKMPMPTGTPAQREAFWNKLVSELPAFLDFLMKWQIPDELKCERFGVKHFHHPDLVEAMDGLAPQTRLLGLIDAVFWPAEDPEFKVNGKRPKSLCLTAMEIESQLVGDQFVGYEARRLLNWSSATGTYLARLAKQHPDRVQQERSAKERKWLIHPPHQQDAPEAAANTTGKKSV